MQPLDTNREMLCGHGASESYDLSPRTSPWFAYEKSVTFLFFPRSVVFCILTVAVPLWISNIHWAEDVWCLWSWPAFSSQTFLNGCLCAVGWLISSMPWRDSVSAVSFPTFPNLQPLTMERALKASQRLELTSSRLLPRCVILGNSLPSPSSHSHWSRHCLQILYLAHRHAPLGEMAYSFILTRYFGLPHSVGQIIKCLFQVQTPFKSTVGSVNSGILETRDHIPHIVAPHSLTCIYSSL